MRLIWSLQVSWQLLFSAPECCVTEWSVCDGWSPWQLARDDSWGGNWEMSPCYECKSLCVLARIAELAAVMQSLGTVQALYPSKISHSISSNATCHCTPPHIQSRLQTGLSNIFKKLPNTHFSFYIYTVNRKVCVWAWYEWYVCWYWKSLLFVFLLPFFLTWLIG